MKNELKYIGDNIKEARNRTGMTIEQVAEAANISDSFLGLVERKKSGISVEVLIKLAKVLEVSTDSLVIEGSDRSAAPKETKKATNKTTLISLIQNSTDDEIDFMLEFCKLFKRQRFEKKKNTENE